MSKVPDRPARAPRGNNRISERSRVRGNGVYAQYTPRTCKRVRRAHTVAAFVYSQILIAAQNPSGQLFAASEKPRRDLVPESNMLFIGAAASRGTSGLMVNVPTLTRVGVKWTPGLRARGSMIVTARRA